jgi:hypothetical protein
VAQAPAVESGSPRTPDTGPTAPWCERWIEAARVPPWLAGVGISATLLAVLLAVEAAEGELQRVLRGEAASWKVSEYRFSLVFALLAGYLPPVWVYAVRASRRAFADLRPVLEGAHEDLDALGRSIGRFDRRTLRRVGLAGVALALVLPILVDLSPRVYGFSDLNTAALGHRLIVPVLLWLMARISYAWITDSRRLVALSRERLRVDLLDLTPTSPLARYGLQNALASLGSFSILSLMLVDWASRPGLPFVIGGLLLLGLALGTAGLLLPVRGARTVIQDAKRRELAWCRREIHRRREALAGAAPARRNGTLDELVAYHGLVQSVHEWPFDAPTLGRFAIYLAIPVGSWLGGAMVERLVDRLLG